jgi:hypothetical protein
MGMGMGMARGVEVRVRWLILNLTTATIMRGEDDGNNE